MSKTTKATAAAPDRNVELAQFLPLGVRLGFMSTFADFRNAFHVALCWGIIVVIDYVDGNDKLTQGRRVYPVKLEVHSETKKLGATCWDYGKEAFRTFLPRSVRSLTPLSHETQPIPFVTETELRKMIFPIDQEGCRICRDKQGGGFAVPRMELKEDAEIAVATGHFSYEITGNIITLDK